MSRRNLSRRLSVESLEDRAVPASALLAVGIGPGGPAIVRVIDPATGADIRTFVPYGAAFTGGVNVALGDVNGDGSPDIITGVASGGESHVKVFDGATGLVLKSFFAFPGFLGGISVAAGDVNNDGRADIIVGAGAGAGPHVKVFSGATGAQHYSFFAYGSGFGGGVRVAAGDLNGDGFADIITGAGAGAGPHVKAFSGATGAELRSFFAYAPVFAGGVNVAAGDVNGDGQVDIVTGAGALAPHVEVFNGTTLALQASFFTSPGFAGGVNVATSDVNGDGSADIVAGALLSSQVQDFSGKDLSTLQNLLAFPGFTGGVSVAGISDTTDPTIISVTAEQPSNDTVSSLRVTFSEPINPSTFTPDDVTLNLSVFPNPRSLMSIVPIDSTSYRLNLGPAAAPTQLALSQTAIAATYNLTVDATGVTDLAGNVGVGTSAATWTTGNHALRDLYVFRSPANANNTVLVLDTGTFPGNLSTRSFDTGRVYRINADLTGDAIEDFVYEATFGLPDTNGVQDVTLTQVVGGVSTVVAQGKTGTTSPVGVNLPIAGGGMFRAGIHDDPFFFDQGAFNTLMSTGAGFPRPVGQARDFFGPNGNTLAIVLEVPSNTFPFDTTNPNRIAGFWGSADVGGVQVDRTARPEIDDILIPPVPRSRLTRGDRRVDFRFTAPAEDRLAAPGGFRDDMIFVLTDPQGIYKRTQADAGFLADSLLPDLLMFQIGNPNGFGTTVGPGPGFFTGPFAGGQVLGNGRRFPDDVFDIEFNLLTNGAIPSDNVGDDNGLKVTDGSVDPVSGQTRAIAFPYMGLANLPFNGPGTGPNP